MFIIIRGILIKCSRIICILYTVYEQIFHDLISINAFKCKQVNRFLLIYGKIKK